MIEKYDYLSLEDKVKVDIANDFEECAVTVDDYPNAVLIAKGAYKAYLKLLQESVEKQIPKKVKRKVRRGFTTDLVSSYCPVCKKLLGVHINYCDNCGQALMWECGEKHE